MSSDDDGDEDLDAENQHDSDSSNSAGLDQLWKRLVNQLVQRQLKLFGIKVTEKLHRLATCDWTAKLHKTPPSQRLIAASHACATKQLSQFLTRCLRQITGTLRKEYNRRQRRDGVNRFWIANNAEDVLRTLNEINADGMATYIETLDFSTLYTNIPHDDLKLKLADVVAEAFEIERKLHRGKQVRLAVYSRKAAFVTKPRKDTQTVSEAELCHMLNFLIYL